MRISPLDRHLLRDRRWYVRNDGYVYAIEDGRTIYLHRLILGAKKGQYVDHINRNPSDNRRENLRFVTHQQNILNNAATGASWDKKRKRWCVYLKKNYKTIFVGRFRTKPEALRGRRIALAVLFPEYGF
jgi:hypothetical protein